jgi:peptidoglycan/LPS O-acetylase OafA/YrhL
MTRPADIKALSGARALPPLMIVLYHFCDAHKYVPLAPVLGPPVTKGYLWVEFFFALSGFILVHVYGTGGKAFRYGDFLKARLARLYPLHLATLLSMLALMWGLNALAQAYHYVSIYNGPDPPLNTLASFIANLFLVQAWNIVPGLSWNGPAWFVSVEFLLCLVFPAYLWLSRGGARRGVALVIAGIAWLVLLSWNSHVGLDITFQNGAFRGMAGFAIGVGMAMLYRNARTSAIRNAPEWQHSAVQAAALLALWAALYLSGPRHSRADVLTAVAIDALVLVLAFDKGFLARLLSTAAMQKLGEWSFGIYMGQMFWMQVIRQFDERTVRYEHARVLGMPFDNLMRIAEPVAVLLVCIVWGALLARYVEQPANTALRRLFAPRKPSRSA